jgi:hypothetical protein
MNQKLITFSVLKNVNLLFVNSNYMVVLYYKVMLRNGKDLVKLIKGHHLL